MSAENETVIEYRVEWRASTRARWIAWAGPVWADRLVAQPLGRVAADRDCSEKRARYHKLEFRVVSRTVTRTDWEPL